MSNNKHLNNKGTRVRFESSHQLLQPKECPGCNLSGWIRDGHSHSIPEPQEKGKDPVDHMDWNHDCNKLKCHPKSPEVDMAMNLYLSKPEAEKVKFGWEKECLNGHKIMGIGEPDICPECEEPYKPQGEKECEHKEDLNGACYFCGKNMLPTPQGTLPEDSWEKEFDNLYEGGSDIGNRKHYEKFKSFIKSLLAQAKSQTIQEVVDLVEGLKREEIGTQRLLPLKIKENVAYNQALSDLLEKIKTN